MKLSTNTDFTKLPRAGKVVRAHDAASLRVPFDIAVLPHDERRLRRKVVTLVHGDKVLVDLAEQVSLEHGDRLLLDDGRNAEVIAGEEELYEVRAGAATPLNHLAWHLGGRHVAAQIEDGRILILRDHAIRDMLVGLGAAVAQVSEPFEPLDGDHHGHAHGGKADAWGRMPGDPHYGHNHGPHEPHRHDHGHDHGHVHEHHGDQHGHGHHAHGERDKFGRLPGDPHYGHNHA